MIRLFKKNKFLDVKANVQACYVTRLLLLELVKIISSHPGFCVTPGRTVTPVKNIKMIADTPSIPSHLKQRKGCVRRQTGVNTPTMDRNPKTPSLISKGSIPDIPTDSTPDIPTQTKRQKQEAPACTLHNMPLVEHECR
jgi:hypothetical protein